MNEAPQLGDLEHRQLSPHGLDQTSEPLLTLCARRFLLATATASVLKVQELLD